MTICDEKEKAVLEDLKFTSNRISEVTRYIGYGSVALVFTILTSKSNFSQSIASDSLHLLLIIGSLGSLSILLDYFHYFISYLQSIRVLNTEDFSYDKTPILKGIRNYLFWGKQCASVTSAILIFSLITLHTIH